MSDHHQIMHDSTESDAEIFARLVPERILLAPEDFDAFVAMLDAPPTPEQAASLERLLSRPTVFDK